MTKVKCYVSVQVTYLLDNLVQGLYDQIEVLAKQVGSNKEET